MPWNLRIPGLPPKRTHILTNQLTRENNQAAGKTWVWTYNEAGNITSRKEYNYTTEDLTGNPDTVSYGYSTSAWGDLLTSYNNQTVVSDTIGNITRVGSTRSFTWKHGRQLASSTYINDVWNYTYNADGMRVKRTSGNKAYTYIYNGDMLRYMEYDSNTTDNVAAAKLYFTFDASGLPISVNYTPEGSTTSYLFYYVHNLQGDVEALVHGSTGNVSIWYSYDAWGNTVVSGHMPSHPGADTLININPFRYRSYVYDTETELYYLQSRYYDPEMGRFISADAFVTTGQGLLGNNMFAYCGNNSVNFSDYSGQASVHFAPMLRMESPHSPNYILDQDNKLIGALPLGSSTVGKMGCGVVATYNALLSLGDYHTFDEVYNYYTATPFRLAGNGELGISFFTISTFFSDLGYKVLVTCDPQQIDRASRNADACILLYNYYNQKLGGHFIEYSRYGSSYIGRNTSTASGIKSFNSPAEYGYEGNRIFAIAVLIYEWPS